MLWDQYHTEERLTSVYNILGSVMTRVLQAAFRGSISNEVRKEIIAKLRWAIERLEQD